MKWLLRVNGTFQPLKLFITSTLLREVRTCIRIYNTCQYNNNNSDKNIHFTSYTQNTRSHTSDTKGLIKLAHAEGGDRDGGKRTYISRRLQGIFNKPLEVTCRQTESEGVSMFSSNVFTIVNNWLIFKNIYTKSQRFKHMSYCKKVHAG